MTMKQKLNLSFSFMLFSSFRPLVAIDIGSYSIKLVQLNKTTSGYELLNMGMITLPPDSVVDGEIENAEAVIIACKNLIKAETLRNRNVVMSISGQSVIIKKISVPQMTDEELNEMIMEEAEQYIPFDIDEVNLDFQIVKMEEVAVETGEGGQEGEGEEEEKEKQMDILIVAARKDTIQIIKDVVKEVGLNLRVLDLDVFALENTFDLNYSHDFETTIALVNIGATMTNINIIEAGITAFTRDMPIGGNIISEEIQKNLSIGFSEAEKLKLGIMFNDFKKSDIIPHVLTGVNAICSELKKTFELYEKTGDFKISRIFLSGGSCLMEGIEALIEKNLGLETQLIKTFQNIHIKEDIFDPEYVRRMEPVMALPVGLAIRMVDDK